MSELVNVNDVNDVFVLTVDVPPTDNTVFGDDSLLEVLLAPVANIIEAPVENKTHSPYVDVVDVNAVNNLFALTVDVSDTLATLNDTDDNTVVDDTVVADVTALTEEVTPPADVADTPVSEDTPSSNPDDVFSVVGDSLEVTPPTGPTGFVFDSWTPIFEDVTSAYAVQEGFNQYQAYLFDLQLSFNWTADETVAFIDNDEHSANPQFTQAHWVEYGMADLLV